MRGLSLLLGLLLAPLLIEGRGFDSQAGVIARNYPIGARASVTGGYTATLWADDPLPDPDPEVFAPVPAWRYGYVRPVISLDSSYVISRGSAEVEFFPISVFGLAAGTSVASRGGFDFPDFDCERISCDGTLRKKHLRSQLVLGAGGWSFLWKNRIDWFEAGSAARPFLDDLSNLVARPGRDELRSATAALGYRLNGRWMTGLAVDLQKFSGSGSHNQGTYWILNGRSRAWRALAGAGVYRSSHQELEPSVFLDLRWIGRRGPGLTDD